MSARWTTDDTDCLADNWGAMTDGALYRRLGRTRDALEVRAKRLGISRKMNVLSARDVGRLFGVDSHIVIRYWIANGLLEARRSPIGCGGGRVWDVDADSLERFVRHQSHVYDVRRMSQGEYWTNLAREIGRDDPWLVTAQVEAMHGLKRGVVSRYCTRGWLEGVRTWGEHGHQVWKVRRSAALGFRWRRPELVGHRGRSFGGVGE